MKIISEVPDKEMKLSKGDKVEVYVKEDTILFSVFCNYDGCVFELTKEELKKMLK